MNDVLEIKNFSLCFKEHTLFRNFAYTFTPGIYAFSGESGVGKSTLMRAIAGLNRNYTGDILLNGQRITGYGPQVYMMHQHYMSFPWLNLLDNVLMVYKGGRQKIRPEDRVEARQVLERIGLGDHMYKRPAAISGGQDQRDNIANAFMNKWSRVFLFDEPTSALDEENIQMVARLMREYQQKHESIYIVISHQDSLIKALDATIVPFTKELCLRDA